MDPLTARNEATTAINARFDDLREALKARVNGNNAIRRMDALEVVHRARVAVLQAVDALLVNALASSVPTHSADAVKDMRVEQDAFVDREIENSMKPRPSADARAKLEQAVREWQEAKRDVRRVINSTEHHPEGTTYAAMRRLDAAEDALLALPPHEGETPQPAAETHPFDICGCGHERESHHVWGKCHRTPCKCSGFVLQSRYPVSPAAESGWQPIDDGNIFVFCDRVDSINGRACVRGAGHNGPHAMAFKPYPRGPVLSLVDAPPVVQTRPED